MIENGMPRVHYSFAQILKEAKARRKMTNASLAKALSISVKTAEQWLAGDRTPLVITQEGALARLSGKPTENTSAEDLKQIYTMTFAMTGMSQAEFAAALGVTEETVALRFGGALPITVEAMLALQALATLLLEDAEDPEMTATA